MSRSRTCGPAGRALPVDEALLNHLALPAQLPQHQDHDPGAIEAALFDLAIAAAEVMRDLPNNSNHQIWDSVRRSLLSSRSAISAGERLERSALLAELRHVPEKDFLSVNIRSQNAAILLQRYPETEDELLFEVFEASPRCEDVIAADNALQWDFPGSAVAVPLSVFNDEAFLSNLAAFLEQASLESTKAFAALTNKAGLEQTESRETADPSLISSLLVALLEANGRRVSTAILRKRVRDDVLWKNSMMPWRRLPIWLILRVSIQRFLSLRLAGEHGRVEYKFFMCVLLMGLTDKVLFSTSMERLSHLKTKLCRRLAKLEVDASNATKSSLPRYDYLFTSLSPLFSDSISRACEKIDNTWQSFKSASTRQIRPLPRRADRSELRLSLRKSSPYLHGAVSRFQKDTMRSPAVKVVSKTEAKALLSAFPETYFRLYKLEDHLEQHCKTLPFNEDMDFAIAMDYASAQEHCTELAQAIRKYLDDASTHYKHNAEQMSIMLLTIMELWMRLDQAACFLYPLLENFHPYFMPGILDSLRLMQVKDMARLQAVQDHLKARLQGCAASRQTIFDDPSTGTRCFAERFFDESEDSTTLQDLLDHIERVADKTLEKKQEEWTSKSQHYEELTRMINQSSCVFIADPNNPLGRGFHDRRCERCDLQKQQGRMKIEIFEHPLPSDAKMKKVVAFELACPEPFQVYRDITWYIIASLALSSDGESFPPKCTIRTYSELGSFCQGVPSSVVLGSRTKSFLHTHYARVSFPVDWDGVCKPNGLNYSYYDHLTQLWPGRRQSWATFAPHCAPILPSTSPFKSLAESIAAGRNTPSSYEIIAHQSSCPPGVNVHEFVAVQSLMGGTTRRWLALLTELGSSNVNFSTEATVALVNHLVTQCGPANEGGDVIRAAHSVFRDGAFCNKLGELVARRLDGLVGNWREVHLMDALITITLRCYFLTLAPEQASCRDRALDLLERARAIALRWMTMLRDETRKAKDPETASRCQQYALWAATLCMRTLAVIASHDARSFDPSTLRTLIECSTTLQTNLTGDPRTLPLPLRNSILGNFKMIGGIQDSLQQSIQEMPEDFVAALSSIWPEPHGLPRQVAKMRLDDVPGGWVTATIAAANDASTEQTIRYNYLHGLLLVDGMPVGQLPPEYKRSLILKELFGEQSLMTYPSSLRGMTYTLNIVENRHHIHVGFCGSGMVIRATLGDRTLELIPREVFGSPDLFDLPGPLVDCQYHWLDLQAEKVEIRPKPWVFLRSNWLLDLRTGACTRKRGEYSEILVDPHLPLSHRVARIFDGFEARRQVTVYQKVPLASHTHPKSSLAVELRRLQLTFWVNAASSLQCPALQAEIDYNQDAGTWYGLSCKLVLKEVESGRRVILVPFGTLSADKSLDHVTIRVEPTGEYDKFVINEILGRIDCAAEPRLIYRKAELHAYTSAVLPDPLTRKTGAEEALHWLSSGTCQPWLPLSMNSFRTLTSISCLCPVRKYYPEDMRVMKTETWQELPSSMQHEAFRHVIAQIIGKSEQLRQFTSQATAPGLQEALVSLRSSSTHLNLRGWFRRALTQRRSPSIAPPEELSDRVYSSRDRSSSAKRSYANVLETVSLIRGSPAKIKTESNLARVLSQCTMIHGYAEAFDKLLLTDRLEVDIRREWGALVRYSLEHGADHYAMMFLFAPISFRFDSDMSLIRTLVAFGHFAELRVQSLPEWPEYSSFQPNQALNSDYLVQLMKPFQIPPPEDDRHELYALMSAKEMRKMRNEKLNHERKAESDCSSFARFLVAQWPCPEPGASGLTEALLVDVPGALEAIQKEWLRLFQNKEFSDHLTLVQEVLDRRQSDVSYQPPEFVASADVMPGRIQGKEAPDLAHDLMRRIRPIMNPAHSAESRTELARVAPRLALPLHPSASNAIHGHSQSTVSSNADVDEVKSIVSHLTDTKSAVRQKYGEELQHSLRALEVYHQVSDRIQETLEQPDAERKRQAVQLVSDLYSSIKMSLELIGPDFSGRQVWWLRKGQLWPAISPSLVLEQLGSNMKCQFGTGMRETILQYGVAITGLQRELRLYDLSRHQSNARHREEALNRGHTNWRPEEHPDWLLLEIESNLLIRPDQVDVALATISPASSANSVLQMNMGQGKTSCVIPMAALVVANGRNLARVIIPKALLQQTGELLHSRLGGLLNRQIRHVPFSRRTPTDEKTIRMFRDIHRDMIRTSGVMLCLPEHILSFKLSGRQRLLDNSVPEASPMIRAQEWLNSRCRDILDESDHTLAVRTQLIYPSGEQMAVDGHPYRWLVAESVLQLVSLHLRGLQKAFPHSIEVVQRSSGGYPLVFFLRPDVETALSERLVNDICRGNGSVLPVSALGKSERTAIKEFISEPRVNPTTISMIRHLRPDNIQVRQTVYLLRGLLVNRILLMTLKKRWNVQYGLHPQRDPIAVPFHAKGVPSEQSEWGHPDVAILFTCLAFYYDGINPRQLRQSLELVLKADDPSSEYDRWTQTSKDFPGSLRDWSCINMDDEYQLEEIWRSVRYNVVVVDFYLNNFVFPRHAKQFNVKLQSNGWDIPMFTASPNLAASGNLPTPSLTTGFSGTNDNRSMLPLNIEQQDLPRLSHTNAEVLTYLLHPRNRGYKVIASAEQGRLTEAGFLKMLRDKRFRLLIDAGAQILEMDNFSLVKTWLEIDIYAPAALYFDEATDKPWILNRNHGKTPLIASTYADDLKDCVVYIDEAHTRGTDLKLPVNARGALTLGLGQTKDHTVQAAMRLRQLASTQSVTFFAPPEVNQSILDLRHETSTAQISSHDVISWLLANTCEGIEQLQPLYYSQGIDFCRRTQAEADNPDFLTNQVDREAYVKAIRQDEQQTLQQLYEPRQKSRMAVMKGSTNPVLSGFVKELNHRRRAFQDTGNAVHGSALQEVEQEREVAFEVESVRQVKKPPQYSPLGFGGLNRELEAFAYTGRLAADSHAYHHFLTAMSRTTLGRKFGISKGASASQLFVSSEFERTIKNGIAATNDNYLRPVNWILWSHISESAIIVIPEEAELLITILRQAKAGPTALLIYAAPITRKMLHFNQLKFYSIPALPADWVAPEWLTTELGIFSGRLYFEWHEYEAVRQFLGVSEEAMDDLDDERAPMGLDGVSEAPPTPGKSHVVTIEGEVGEGTGEETAMNGNSIDNKHPNSNITAPEECPKTAMQKQKAPTRHFTSKPLQFIQEWLAVRRRGQDFIPTPMGFITQTKPLDEHHPFFQKIERDQVSLRLQAPVARRAAAEDEDVDEDVGEDMIVADDDESSSDSDEAIAYNDDEMYSSGEGEA